MWNCSKCGKRVKDSLDLCWNCGAASKIVEEVEVGAPPRGESDRKPLLPADSVAAERWTCAKCGETVEASWDICWNCEAPKWAESQPDGEQPVSKPRNVPSSVGSRAAFRHFEAQWESWEEMFQKAADFASGIGPKRLISISHSEDHNTGVVTVWYWEK